MEIEIGNRKAEVEWLGKNGNDVQVSIDGRTIGANVVLTDNGICSILYQGRSYNMEAVSFEGGRRYKVKCCCLWISCRDFQRYKVKCGYDSYDVRVIDAQARYQQARNGGEARQDDNLSAPMPGKVVRVMVQPGDRVAAGDTLLVFEAMKMQSNLKVTGDCTVREILVAEGETVAGGALLVKLDVLQNESDNHGKE